MVVYKVDRLTRSLADFAKIVEILRTGANRRLGLAPTGKRRLVTALNSIENASRVKHL